MAGKKNDKKDAGAKDKKGKGAKGEEVAADANKQKVAQAIIVRHIIVCTTAYSDSCQLIF